MTASYTLNTVYANIVLRNGDQVLKQTRQLASVKCSETRSPFLNLTRSKCCNKTFLQCVQRANNTDFAQVRCNDETADLATDGAVGLACVEPVGGGAGDFCGRLAVGNSGGSAGRQIFSGRPCAAERDELQRGLPRRAAWADPLLGSCRIWIDGNSDHALQQVAVLYNLQRATVARSYSTAIAPWP